MTPRFTATVDLIAHRGVVFADVTAFDGFDYSDAAFTMEIRRYGDASGEPLVALAKAGPTAQGISCTVATVGPFPVSTVTIRINETTIEGLPFTSPRGGDWAGKYALDIAGGGHPKLRRMEGAFTVRASANG
jgi:hypothetical protein